MGRPKKKVYEGGELPEVDLETRRRIIEAAGTLFMSNGFKGVSMKDVADEIQVTAAALYYHFPKGKEDLFWEMLKNFFEDWATGVPAAVEHGKNTREKLMLLTMHFLRSPFSQLPMLLRDVTHLLQDDEIKQKIWKHYGTLYIEAISRVFEEGIEANEISQSIPAHTMASLLQGMCMSLLHNPRLSGWRNDPVEADRFVQTIVSIMLDGVGLRQTAALV